MYLKPQTVARAMDEKFPVPGVVDRLSSGAIYIPASGPWSDRLPAGQVGPFDRLVNPLQRWINVAY